MRKIFCIGMYKTGTTSMGKALSQLGFRTFHGCNPYLKLPINSFNWDRDIFSQYSSRVKNLVELYDAFEDYPFMFIYREMQEAFPDARFILTERDAGKVADSDINMWKQLGQHPIPDRQKFIDRYTSHHAEVLDYFGDSESLLRMRLGEGNEWTRLCDFLDLPVPQGVSFPHAHRRPYGAFGGALFRIRRIVKDVVRNR